MFTLKTFYKSKQWETFRRLIINERMDPDGFVRCAECGQPIVKPYDLIVHHKTELTDLNVNDYSISLNPDNVVCVHFKCHNKIHKRFGYGTGGYKPPGKKAYIVYGAPCSGKTSWVNDVASADDVIIDMDSIYQMISINDRYIKPDTLRAVAFMIRDQLYDVVKYRNGKWNNAYVIVGGALRGERERLMKRVNADECIFIEAGRDECIERARAGRPKEFINYINDWFDSFQK